jgi:SAM-dependent methyltransferase
VTDGVPRLNEALQEHRLTNVARAFGFEWKAHHHGQFETDTLFGRTREQDWDMVMHAMRISAADVRGAIVLDAGCGSGRFCQLFAEHGAATVIGVDMNDAVAEAARHCRDYENVHIVQANIFALPFQPAVFDLIWCNGVIHHTPDAASAHCSLAKHVRPGGILYVWVYPDRFNPFRLVKTVLRRTGPHRWPPRALQLVASMLAYMSVPMLALYRAARVVPGLRPRTPWGVRSVRPRTLEELKLTWFDALSPEFDSRHTEDEVIEWFRREGFSGIAALEEPKVGVRGVASDTPYGTPSS